MTITDKKEYSGWLGDCSEEQLKALGSFRQSIAAAGIKNPAFDDTYLLRFLRARKFDLPKTHKMWDNFIQWRKENDVDNIGSFDFHEVENVKRYYPHGYFRTDREGRPVYIERLGMLQYDNVFKYTTEKRLIQHYTQSYERLINHIFPLCSEAAGQPCTQTTCILDLKDVHLGMMTKGVYNFIKIYSQFGQDYYPELMAYTFIVNPPFIFRGIWFIVKEWLDEKTRNKIKVLGHDYHKELFKVVDPENLPDFLGGKVPVSEYGEYMNKEQGPWVPGSVTTKKVEHVEEKKERKILRHEPHHLKYFEHYMWH